MTPYQITVLHPGDLTDAEYSRCLGIIRSGEAISIADHAHQLHTAERIALARTDDVIVGIYAIKSPAPQRAQAIMARAAATFDADTPELGYAAIDPAHRGKGLSTAIRAAIMAAHRGPLYAVTSNPASIHGLDRAGFIQAGHPWRGRRGDDLRLFTYTPGA